MTFRADHFLCFLEADFDAFVDAAGFVSEGAAGFASVAAAAVAGLLSVLPSPLLFSPPLLSTDLPSPLLEPLSALAFSV